MLSHRSDELCFLARVVKQLDSSETVAKIAGQSRLSKFYVRRSDMMKLSATSCRDMESSLATDEK
eukprot:scaffold54706_cov20-Prasinocladus_malaysianus.AAC.1